MYVYLTFEYTCPIFLICAFPFSSFRFNSKSYNLYLEEPIYNLPLLRVSLEQLILLNIRIYSEINKKTSIPLESHFVSAHHISWINPL